MNNQVTIEGKVKEISPNNYLAWGIVTKITFDTHFVYLNGFYNHKYKFCGKAYIKSD